MSLFATAFELSSSSSSSLPPPSSSSFRTIKRRKINSICLFDYISNDGDCDRSSSSSSSSNSNSNSNNNNCNDYDDDNANAAEVLPLSVSDMKRLKALQLRQKVLPI